MRNACPHRRLRTVFCTGTAMLLAACNPGQPEQPDTAKENSTTAPPATAAPTPAQPTAAAAKPLVLDDTSDVLDFHYAIPAKAAAIPALRDLLTGRADRLKGEAIRDQADDAENLPKGVSARPFGRDIDWNVVGETDQLLVLVSTGYRYDGGAHGSDVYDTLVWDKQAGREISFDALFTDKAGALATIRESFCDKLDEARLKKRGTRLEGDNSFTRCPAFDRPITLAFTHPVGGKFGRVGVYIPADIAGPHAEGSYEFTLFIPKAMIPHIAERYRPSFPGAS